MEERLRYVEDSFYLRHFHFHVISVYVFCFHLLPHLNMTSWQTGFQIWNGQLHWSYNFGWYQRWHGVSQGIFILLSIIVDTAIFSRNANGKIRWKQGAQHWIFDNNWSWRVQEEILGPVLFCMQVGQLLICLVQSCAVINTEHMPCPFNILITDSSLLSLSIMSQAGSLDEAICIVNCSKYIFVYLILNSQSLYFF